MQIDPINLNTQTGLEGSATVMINSLAQNLIASGKKIYNLSVGEPSLPMHELLIKAAIDAMHQGKIAYPPVSGIMELRSLAIEWMNHSFYCSYQLENALVVNGGKFGIYLLLQLLLNPGDEVMMASPYWVSYPAIVQLFKGRPCIIATDESEGWKLTPEKLRLAYTVRSKILIINNGANPTGAIYTKQELASILSFAKENQLLVISDEVYSGLTYDNHIYTSCGCFPAYQDNVVVIQSCSKNFSMTGWRVGFVFGHASIINRLISLMSQSTSGVTTVSQWLAATALENEDIITTWVRNTMKQRRDSMIHSFHTHFNISLVPPASALYLFISLEKLGVTNTASADFCKKILQDIHVACVPGSAFGKEGYIRFSFGANEDDVITGVKMLAEIYP